MSVNALIVAPLIPCFGKIFYSRNGPDEQEIIQKCKIGSTFLAIHIPHKSTKYLAIIIWDGDPFSKWSKYNLVEFLSTIITQVNNQRTAKNVNNVFRKWPLEPPRCELFADLEVAKGTLQILQVTRQHFGRFNNIINIIQCPSIYQEKNDHEYHHWPLLMTRIIRRHYSHCPHLTFSHKQRPTYMPSYPSTSALWIIFQQLYNTQKTHSSHGWGDGRLAARSSIMTINNESHRSSLPHWPWGSRL